MGHPYTIREIARQAGLSEATVDRVLNQRGGVRESTAREVQQAIKDLDRQRTQVRIGGRTFMIDIVMQTRSGSPRRYATPWRPNCRPCTRRSSAHGSTSARRTRGGAGEGPRQDRRARFSGVILKAPEVPEVTAAVGRLVAAGIPVVTLVTDLPSSPRLAYVGIDNRAAGATAAYLIRQWLADRPGHVLVTISRGPSATRRSARWVSAAGCAAAGPAPTGRGHGQRRAGLHPAGPGPGGSGAGSGDQRRLLHRRRQHRDHRRLRGARPGSAGLRRARPGPRQHPAAGGGNCPRCSTTTCARTCGAPVRPSCGPSRRCRTRARSCRRRSRW